MARFRAKDPTKELIDQCTEYLNDNFSKFSQSNKIKISLEIFKRRIPQQLEHSGEIEHTLFFKDIIRKSKDF